jgi:hypothetical protein
MTRIVDLTERRFGRFLVLRRANDHLSPSGRRYVMWLCRCDCGQERAVLGDNLRSGATASCGCFKLDQTRKAKTTHGHRAGAKSSHVYGVWAAMHRRCRNPQDKSWVNYGGRGIKVCPQWHDFAVFLGDMGEPHKGMTLDRIDVNGDYCPENCRWATMREQQNNRSNNRRVVHRGISMTLADASRKSGIEYSVLYARSILLGWPDEALFAPVRPRNHQR